MSHADANDQSSDYAQTASQANTATGSTLPHAPGGETTRSTTPIVPLGDTTTGTSTEQYGDAMDINEGTTNTTGLTDSRRAAKVASLSERPYGELGEERESKRAKILEEEKQEEEALQASDYQKVLKHQYLKRKLEEEEVIYDEALVLAREKKRQCIRN